MVQFLKMTFACILGTLVTGLILFLLGILFLGGIFMFSNKTVEYTSKNNSVLYIKLKGEITDRAQENLPGLLYSEIEQTTQGLNNLLTAIDVAEADANIKGIYLEELDFSTGFATIEELRNRLINFKKSGKFIYSYADNYSQKGYYLASAADSIFLNPVGGISLSGLSAQPIFFKNALQKVGIEMQIFRVGTFKSAVEPFIVDKMTAANQEQTRVYLGSMWNHIVQECAISRKLTPSAINNIADSLTALMPAEALLNAKLITALAYRDRMTQLLAEKCEISKEKINFVSPQEAILSSLIANNSQNENIAIVYAEGEIDGMDAANGINSRRLVNTLNKLQNDSSIKGIVMRVNSPGGSAFGAEQIWHAVNELNKVKPVVASMGDYAASGGYYIACPARRIFAQPTTLTGSIGIYGMIPNAQELLTDKLGLSFDEVKTNKYSNFPVLNRPMTLDEKQAMQASVDRGYKLFVKRCADGRKKSIAQIENIAEGRVWSGINAKQNGLVDQYGGIFNAVDWVAQEAKISNYTILEYPTPKTTMEILLEWWNGNVTKLTSNTLPSVSATPQIILEHIKKMSGTQARMEWIIPE